MLKINRHLYLIALLAMICFFSTLTVMADVERPGSYESLRPVELQNEKAPRLQNGFSSLSSSEHRYRERLPVQLTGAIEKIKKSKYQPKVRSKQI